MDSQWLKTQFLAYPDRTKAGLATAIGLEPPAVSKILNGTRQIKAQEYILMREYFGLPNDGENTLRKPPARTHIKALVGGDGLGDRSPPPGEWDAPAPILSRSPSALTKVFLVSETIMEPEFKLGEQVLIDPLDRTPSPPGVFVISDGQDNMLRHCELVGSDIRISASKTGFHKETLSREHILILGRVIAKLQML